MGLKDDGIHTNNVDEESGLEVKPIRTWKGHIWDTFDLPKDQRKLLFKLDAFILGFASVSTTRYLRKTIILIELRR
jgi:MFS transporter, ACS family, pantothenate transporter